MGKLIKGLFALILIVGILAVGAWLVVRKGDIPYATLEKSYATPASKYQDLAGGVRIHYRDQGKADGPVIVLVHGFFVSLETWEPWVKRLGQDYRVITLDLPGHGLTRAPVGWPMSVDSYVSVVEAFAKAKSLDKFVIGGSSMGGNVAWEYALAHPERTKGLILVDSAGWPAPKPSAEQQKMADLFRNPVSRFVVRDLDSSAQIKKGLQGAYAQRGVVTDAMLNRYIELNRAPGHRDAIIDIMLGGDRQKPATAERLARIGVPTLVLHGAKDSMVPPADGRRFADSIPGAKLIVYQDSGHVVQEEAADASAADVKVFMASLEPKKAEPPKPTHDNKGKPAVEARDPNAVIFY
jgi:pimeloyl-ACP methyl ester carboxylesterase